jgi:Ribosomal protein HS6-type (S12/L30/L7a)
MIYKFDYALKEVNGMDELRLKPHTAGMRTVLRAVEAGKAERVFIAEDADVFVRRRVQEVCKAQDVPYEYVPDMKTLGDKAGLEIKTACAAVLRA